MSEPAPVRQTLHMEIGKVSERTHEVEAEVAPAINLLSNRGMLFITMMPAPGDHLVHLGSGEAGGIESPDAWARAVICDLLRAISEGMTPENRDAAMRALTEEIIHNDHANDALQEHILVLAAINDPIGSETAEG